MPGPRPRLRRIAKWTGLALTLGIGLLWVGSMFTRVLIRTSPRSFIGTGRGSVGWISYPHRLAADTDLPRDQRWVIRLVSPQGGPAMWPVWHFDVNDLPQVGPNFPNGGRLINAYVNLWPPLLLV